MVKSRYRWLPRRAWPALACALGVWAMAFVAAALLFAHKLLGKRMGEIFRA